MLKGVNDSIADAKALVRLLAKIPAKINLIPFNPWPGAPYECSDWEQIEKFAEVVNRAGYASPVRTPARPRHHGGLRAIEERQHQAARQRAARHAGLGTLRPGERRLEAVVAPEQFIADDEGRRAEQAARCRLLGLTLQSVLGLWRVRRGKAASASTPSAARIVRSVASSLMSFCSA